MMGDCKSPQGWSNLFRRRISNPPERLTDVKITATPTGVYAYAQNGQKLLPQGTALGVVVGAMRPVRAKALKYEANSKLLPLQGDRFPFIIPRAMPWASSFCPFRAYGFQWN